MGNLDEISRVAEKNYAGKIIVWQRLTLGLGSTVWRIATVWQISTVWRIATVWRISTVWRIATVWRSTLWRIAPYGNESQVRGEGGA